MHVAPRLASSEEIGASIRIRDAPHGLSASASNHGVYLLEEKQMAGMKQQQLRYFAAVYEQGSFSAAAEKVNATQSGLSMHVNQIEKRYDVSLFVRSSSAVTPTAAGKAFYLEAVQVLAAANHAEDRIRTLSKSVVGHVNVGLMPTFIYLP